MAFFSGSVPRPPVVLCMCENLKTLFVCDDGQAIFMCDDRRVLAYDYHFGRVDRSIMTDLLLAEQALREHTQREETLHHRVKALQKATTITSDNTQLQEAMKQIEEVKSEYPKKEHALYRAESMLGSTIERLYDMVRRNTKWYMREEMVRDCSDRGGCCSRQCGCCAQRHLSERQKGRGHCTLECWCCISFRGFDLPEEQKEEMRKDLQARLSYNTSQYLQKLATWFVCPIRRQRSKWQQFFGLGLA